jgi:orotate phosphoribosyltransferase
MIVSQSRPVINPRMSSRIERLLQIIIDTSFNASVDPVYPLASGVLSKYYIDCKMALSYAEAREIIGDLIVEQIGSDHVDAVGGLALGAYPMALAVSDAFYRKNRESVRAFVVRKEPKIHGLKKHIEGDVKEGDSVLIVDDVITSGKSTADAIVKSREEGLNVIRAIALIDRQENNGAANIERCGVPFNALLTLHNLIDVTTGK